MTQFSMKCCQTSTPSEILNDKEEGVNEGEEDKDIQEGEQQEATNAEEFKKPKLVKNKRKMEDKVTQIQN